MNQKLRKESEQIIEEVLQQVKPDEAVRRALSGKRFEGKTYIIAVGKAAYQMAKAASALVDYESGIVITKYNHVQGEIDGMTCFEAGHPVPDMNGINGTKAALQLTGHLTEKDTVIFLLSGGGSALFEKPLIPLQELQEITEALLASGAEITEMNTIRKRLSAVKGGKFAEHVAPAKVYSVILSDVLGDPVDMIASGPTAADASTCKEALQIIAKYKINISDSVRELLKKETPKTIENAENIVIGSVRGLCHAAERSCSKLGYQVTYLTDCLNCEARDAGTMFGNIAKSHAKDGCKQAFIAGGETVVHLKGAGRGGRNQEIAVAAMLEIAGLSNVAVLSVGSDGTDGPTDAAGGYADGDSFEKAKELGLDLAAMQQNNDCYEILKATDGLIITGPTGTNVNDFSVVLIG